MKTGIFNGPQIQKLINDSNFTKFMNDVEASACSSYRYVLVIKNFLGNYKVDKYKEFMQNMLTNMCYCTRLHHSCEVRTFKAFPHTPALLRGEVICECHWNILQLGWPEYNMHIKVHYLHSQLDKFPDNFCDFSKKQGKVPSGY